MVKHKHHKMKFKTLKDLYLTKDKLQAEAIREELKAEAVKWVKKYFPINKKGYEFTLGDFMEFFNITEDNLK